MSGLYAFRFTEGPLAGEEFATSGGTLEDAQAAASRWVASEPLLAGAAFELVEAPPERAVRPGEENPRWTRCREALGREPSTLDFILWMGRRWQDFAAARGCRNVDEVTQRVGVHEDFDAWLAEGVRAGLWKVAAP